MEGEFTGSSRIVDAGRNVLYSGADGFIDNRAEWWAESPIFEGFETVVERHRIIGGQVCHVPHHGYTRDGRLVKFYGGGIDHP